MKILALDTELTLEFIITVWEGEISSYLVFDGLKTGKMFYINHKI